MSPGRRAPGFAPSRALTRTQGDRGRGPGRLRRALGDDRTRFGQFGALPAESLLVAARAEHVADHRRPAGHDIGTGRGDLPGRIGVRAVAEDYVEQDRRDLGTERLL